MDFSQVYKVFSEKELNINKVASNNKIDITNELKFFNTNKLTIAVAESLTGGLLCGEFVNYSGVSSVLNGSVTAYTLEIKDKVLNVPYNHTKNTDGVDAKTSKLMAKNVAELLDSDFGLSTTGIAEQYDNRPTQAYITLYDRKNEDFYTLYIEVGKDSGNHNFSRPIVRSIMVNEAIKLFKTFVKERLM